MSEAVTATPHRLLRTNEAADWLGLSGRTLEKHRTFGTGPAYRKIGGRVVYAMEDLQAWADRGARVSTTDATGATVSAARPVRELRSFA
jgi:predicted DNA-binding transcriptional regulator AlpA